ncbi:YfaZ family outer membrane protein [Marinobacter fonticola]|uniref:YfaZ family outer membrane protein n=1 Tax=Marinobacter fonticola TaxID=2603215 RepID=UPI0011E67E79|nr:YfaZ family outer membrane protein [Marinobacter fonticola]
MKYSRLSILALAVATTPALGADFELSLTDDSAKGQVNFTPTTSDIQGGVGYTYHQGSRHIANIDLHAQGRTAIGNLPTTAGIGMRAIGWDDDHVDGGAIGLGGFANMNIPNVPGLSVGGSLHYAPSILSFGDSDDMTSFEARVSYRVIRNAEIFGGYRYLNTELDPSGDINLDEGLMAGMKIFF